MDFKVLRIYPCPQSAIVGKYLVILEEQSQEMLSHEWVQFKDIDNALNTHFL